MNSKHILFLRPKLEQNYEMFQRYWAKAGGQGGILCISTEETDRGQHRDSPAQVIIPNLTTLSIPSLVKDVTSPTFLARQLIDKQNRDLANLEAALEDSQAQLEAAQV